MLQSFPGIRSGFGLMVGVGGGAPNLEKGRDIRLGDVVVSQPNPPYHSVVQYDFGKAIEDGRFVSTSSLNAPPTTLLCALSFAKALNPADLGERIKEKAQEIGEADSRLRHPQSTDRLFEAGYYHVAEVVVPGSEDCSNTIATHLDTCRACDPRRIVERPDREYEHPYMHYGTIASANQVMKDGRKRDVISAQTGALCFEMEAAGLTNDFPCLVIRGISDYSDGHKNKSWQPYASLVAALYAKELLYLIPEVTNSGFVFGKDVVTATLGWLAADSPQEEYDARISDRLEGTCEWIFDKTEYKEWKASSQIAEAPSPQCLWIYGKAGMGKSVLAANIVKDLQSSTFLPCAFYFAIHENLAKRDPLSILRSWLSQLSTADARAFKGLRLMRKGNESRTITELELWELFESCLRVVGPCFLLVDGYDETFNQITPRRSHIGGAREVFLQRVIQCMKGTHARLVITSRDEVDIRRNMINFASTVPVLTTTIEVHPEDTLNDVERFCRYIVNGRFKSSSLNTRRIIVERLSSRSEGMFLWARLSGARLFPGKTLNQILQDLSGPAIGLNDAYERDFARIRDLTPATDRARALKILRWVLFATRPLSALELTEALLVDVARSRLQFQNYPDIIDEDYVNYQILRLSGSLVEFREGEKENEYDDRNKASGHFHLAHFSVKEFFLNDDTRFEEFDECTAHQELATACVSYLVSEEVQQAYRSLRPPASYSIDDSLDSGVGPRTPPLESFTLSKLGLLQYAATEWLVHARAYEHLKRAPLPSLLVLLEKRNIERLRVLLLYYEFFVNDGGHNIYFSDNTHGHNYQNLMSMSRLGLAEAVRYILDRPDATVLVEDLETGIAAITATIYANQAETLDVLLDYYTVEKLRGLVNFLIDEIVFEAISSKWDMIRILDTFIRHGFNQEQFASKLFQRYDAYVKFDRYNLFPWFVDNGVNFDSTCTKVGLLASQSVAGRGRVPYYNRVLKGLIERGGCVNCPLTPPVIKDEELSDPQVHTDRFCYSLIGWGYEELPEEGRTFYFEWPTDLTSSMWSECPKGLHSPDPATLEKNKDGYYRLKYYPGTPLQIAAWYGYEDTVSILVGLGANINYSGGFITRDETAYSTNTLFACNGTALELARQREHWGIVRILEEAGALGGVASEEERYQPRGKRVRFV
ncbi:hypothetical protein TWF281_002254 [Arthrobotrys megalospora]